MKKVIEKMKKRNELIMYLFFGVCTTIINIVSYFVFRYFHLSVSVSTVASWIVSVLFAYITNKLFVFRCRKETIIGLLEEFLSFVSGRLFTGAVDLAMMLVLVDIMEFYEPNIKILSNIVVIVLNYVLSKLWIFRKKR